MRIPHATTLCLLATIALGGCTRANDALDPSALKPPATLDQAALQEGGAVAPQPATPAMPARTSAQAAAILAKTRLQIAPIVGATVEAAAPLTERLAQRARQRGIKLAGSAGDGNLPSTHVLKGYFSAVTEGTDTTVIYVWDIYDPAGNRVHRINGQQKAPSANGGDGWAAVPPSTMQAVADATVDQIATWLGNGAG